MKKVHGPAFRKQQIELSQCPVCRGRAVIKGVFHEMDCVQCNASGWVSADTGEALPLEVLVSQLGMRLQKAEVEILALRAFWPEGGPSDAYEQNNRRGAGGTNYTGD